MIDPYLALKWLHILSSTVLFGTGIGTAFQMVWAMRSQDPRVIGSTAAGVVWADWLFTTPAGVIQPATGIALIWVAGYDLDESWLLTTYALYLLAFLCWAPVVHLQIKIRNLASQAAQLDAPLPAQANRLFWIWFALGWPAFIALMAIFWLMVQKPMF